MGFDQNFRSAGKAKTTMYQVQGQRKVVSSARRQRGVQAQQDGVDAENQACIMLEASGWRILLRRSRTPRGEVDIVAERAGMLVFIEVKKRQTMPQALACLSQAQSRRLYRAAECLLQRNPAWRYETLRFDLIAMDAAGAMEWVEDILRQM
ncbi:YraN family protein [Acetobacter suratthaniensis]|nr:YraN family protein [Acetobacter suratthaniensis]MCX2564915.1 YraN family protein [Acetobacter suratthaniensis]